MPQRATLRDPLLFSATLALGLALSWPGVEARADSDLAPPSRALTGLNAAPAPVAPSVAAAQGDSCAASDPELVGQAYDAQRERLQLMAEAMEAEGGGEVRVLDGRGYGYFPDKSVAIELARLQREAQLQALAEAGAPPQQ